VWNVSLYISCPPLAYRIKQNGMDAYMVVWDVTRGSTAAAVCCGRCFVPDRRFGCWIRPAASPASSIGGYGLHAGSVSEDVHKKGWKNSCYILRVLVHLLWSSAAFQLEEGDLSVGIQTQTKMGRCSFLPVIIYLSDLIAFDSFLPHVMSLFTLCFIFLVQIFFV
jgi:hypothetical protein